MTVMSTFVAPDDTLLAYRSTGAGQPVVCLPGGPMQDADYLDDLGGLSAHRRLVLLDPRGTGRSALPGDTSTYRCDRQVDDVEALRGHLGLDHMDLLAHSAGTNLAVLYAVRYPARIASLTLITPSPRAVDITVSGQTRRDTAIRRRHEPWFPAAFAALEAIMDGTGTDWDAITPFSYGRWDDTTRDHHTRMTGRSNEDAAGEFGSTGAFEPEATRAALASVAAPVLLLAGEFDLNSPVAAVTAYAELFPNATLVVQPGAGHFPWVDDPDRFRASVAAFHG